MNYKNINYLIDFVNKNISKRIILFGTGTASRIISKYLCEKIVYYVDNDMTKIGQFFLEKPVHSPDCLKEENKDDIIVIVASMYYQEISKQLNAMGFVAEKHYWNGMILYEIITREKVKEKQFIKLEYPVNPDYRYGYDKPPHIQLYNIINEKRNGFKELLLRFLQYKEDLLQIKVNKNCIIDEFRKEPFWDNIYMSGLLDTISLYSFIRINKPDKYMEIGSGNSTKFAYKAIRDGCLQTKIISIDPYPRDEIDEICNEVYRQPVEELDIEVFNQLESGDILFVDNSHRCFTNSDVTVFFLEILPKLKKGVIVGIHDIYLPYDYPDVWRDRFYSEQYLLACYILSGCTMFDIMLSNSFVTEDDELLVILDSIWNDMDKLFLSKKRGSCIWLKIK